MVRSTEAADVELTHEWLEIEQSCLRKVTKGLKGLNL